jgi:hypothetical protein
MDQSWWLTSDEKVNLLLMIVCSHSHPKALISRRGGLGNLHDLARFCQRNFLFHVIVGGDVGGLFQQPLKLL